MLWELSVVERSCRIVLEALNAIPVTELAERYGRPARRSAPARCMVYRGLGRPSS